MPPLPKKAIKRKFDQLLYAKQRIEELEEELNYYRTEYERYKYWYEFIRKYISGRKVVR